MNKSKEIATEKANPARALRAELAHKIASFMGNEEKRIREIPGMSLHRRTRVRAEDTYIKDQRKVDPD